VLKNVREPLIRESNRKAPIVTEKPQDGATSHRFQESSVFGHHAAILDGADAGPMERVPDQERDRVQRRTGVDSHSGLPVRRGRRRTVAAMRRSSSSAAATLSRYASNSFRAKYRGFNRNTLVRPIG